ncbi:phage major capsid protein [Streptomyces sp. OK228]|uniref:phage major capsid protein n=1 Tax=Streptomyces sp. OK228 TaxID=1882786 RepID=UPI000BD01965|nr:phage major capsid protein [Streptomyces sp. OK228]SOE30200.1 phage major capsid protein, HK97 family [Streptomyces sp. OK228]
MKPELRKMFDAAEAEDRGLTAREVATVINSIPAEERMARTEILAAVNGENGPTAPETRDSIAETLKYMEMRAVDAREDRARLDREAEVRALVERQGVAAIVTPGSGSGLPGESDEWRGLLPSLSEYRLLQEAVPGDGGYTVPTKVSAQYIDKLTAESTFLRGLPSSSILPFDSATLQVPQLLSTTGMDYVTEGNVIPEDTESWGSKQFSAVKIGGIAWATNEILEDSALPLREIIASNLLRDASLKFDNDAFNGLATAPVKGILAQGNSVTLAAGKVTVTYDDLADAAARIEATNGHPSVIWASVDMAAALRKEKASGSGIYQGGSPTDSAANTAWGLPVLVSGFLPSKTVAVAAADRIKVGVRRNALIKVSEDARFDKDQVGFKLTMRVAGVSLAEASSVQIVKAAAS